MAITIYIWCIYGIFGREIAKYTVIYGVYLQFRPTLHFMILAKLNARSTTTCLSKPPAYFVCGRTLTCMSETPDFFLCGDSCGGTSCFAVFTRAQTHTHVHANAHTHIHTYTHVHTQTQTQTHTGISWACLVVMKIVTEVKGKLRSQTPLKLLVGKILAPGGFRCVCVCL